MKSSRKISLPDEAVTEWSRTPRKLKAHNIGAECAIEHQVVIDNGIVIPPVNHRGKHTAQPKPRMIARVYDAVYILKPGQSTFYALPAGRKSKVHQSLLRSAGAQANKWHKVQAEYVTRTVTEAGVLGCRIWRTK